jgi:hypothetical protein
LIKKNQSCSRILLIPIYSRRYGPFMIHEGAEISLFSLIHQFHQAVFSQVNHGFSSKLSISDPSPSLLQALQRSKGQGASPTHTPFFISTSVLKSLHFSHPSSGQRGQHSVSGIVQLQSLYMVSVRTHILYLWLLCISSHWLVGECSSLNLYFGHLCHESCPIYQRYLYSIFAGDSNHKCESSALSQS